MQAFESLSAEISIGHRTARGLEAFFDWGFLTARQPFSVLLFGSSHVVEDDFEQLASAKVRVGGAAWATFETEGAYSSLFSVCCFFEALRSSHPAMQRTRSVLQTGVEDMLRSKQAASPELAEVIQQVKELLYSRP